MSNEELENGCAVMVWIAVKGEPDRDALFHTITGLDRPTPKQLDMAKDEPFKDPTLVKQLQKFHRRFIELKQFNDYMDKNHRAPEVPQRDDDFGWTQEDDTDLLNAVREIGLGKWEFIEAELERNLETKVPEEKRRSFLKNRFKLLMKRIKNGGREKKEKEHKRKASKKEKSSSSTKKEHSSSSSKKEHSSSKEKSHSKSKSKHSHEPKEAEPIDEPEPVVVDQATSYKHVMDLLKRFGMPSTEELWDIFSELSGTRDAQSIATEIMDGITKVLCGEELSDDSAVKELFDFEAANDIYSRCQWFTKFRDFFTNGLTQIKDLDKKIASLKPNPQWWHHETLDMKFFDHVYRYGTSRPSTLLSQSPFLEFVPDKDRPLVQKSAEKESTQHIPIEVDTARRLSIFIDDEEVRAEIDEIITNLIVADVGRKTIVLEERVPEKPHLPYSHGPTVVESLGSSDMHVVNGYLYCSDFQARVQLDGTSYTCRIQHNSLRPFVITSQGTDPIARASPAEAWEAVTSLKDTDPYELFGIGIPAVRYWFQAMPEHKSVSGYIDINFEEAKKPEAAPPPAEDDADLEFLPSVSRKRKRLPLFPDI